jgi:hypothetical protein
MKRAIAIVVFAWAAAGCSNRDRDPDRDPPPAKVTAPAAPSANSEAAPPAAKESRVFDVKSSNDLLALNSEYMRLWQSGFEGTLEVAVGPGPFTPIGWSLAPDNPDGRASIDIVVKGSGTALPLPGRIRARSVRFENVVFTGTKAGPTEIRVSTDFTMRESMLVDARFSDPNFAGGYLEVFADGGKKTAASVTLEDCWFVRNFQANAPMQMIRLSSRGPSGGHFDQVQVSGSVFLGNAFAVDLSIDTARSVSVEKSLFYRTWATGAELACKSCGDVVVRGSTFVVENLEQIATVEGTPPVLLQDSRVLVKGWKAGMTPPAALSVTQPQLADRKSFEPREAAVAQVITAVTTAPVRVPGADMRAQLDAALRR